MNKANLKSVLTVVRDMIRRNAERGMKLAQSAMEQSRAARILASKAQTTAEAAQTTAEAAQTTAEAAQTTANQVQTTANQVQTTANRAQTTANRAQTTAEAAQTTASKCVQYEPQTLTDAQKTRARLNIGATNNYNDLKNGVHATTEYLEMFLRNLLLGEDNILSNRSMHISGAFSELSEDSLEYAKTDIGNKKRTLRQRLRTLLL